MQISPPLSDYDLSTHPDFFVSPSGVIRPRSDTPDSPRLRDSKRRRRNDDGPRAPELLAHWRSLASDPPSTSYPGSSHHEPSSLQPLLDDLHASYGWGRCTQPAATSAALDYLFCNNNSLPTPISLPQQHFSAALRPELHRSATLPSAAPSSGDSEYDGADVSQYQREATIGGYVNAPVPAHEAALPQRRATDPGASVASGSSSSQKDQFVSGLVGASVIAIESIWGISEGPRADGGVLPLTWFIREVLRRSRTSCSTLQVSLFYLHKCRREIRDSVARSETAALLEDLAKQAPALSPSEFMQDDCYPSPPHTPVDGPAGAQRDRFAALPESAAASHSATVAPANPVLCGRRMFLAALICASKFLQDRNYSNRAWAKISGLPVHEINENERVFLGLMNFSLHLGADDFVKWTERLASLATQGAALESNESSPAVAAVRARAGLARHATEYPPAPPLQQWRVPSTGATSTLPRPHTQLGRARSQPDTLSSSSAAPTPVIRLQVPVAPTLRHSLATPDTSPDRVQYDSPLPLPVVPFALPVTTPTGTMPMRRVVPRRPSVRTNFAVPAGAQQPSPVSPLPYHGSTSSTTLTSYDALNGQRMGSRLGVSLA